MDQFKKVNLKSPYLLFIGDINDLTSAKTASGILEWRPNLVAGQLRFESNSLDLGVPDLDITKAVELGVGSIIIGVAPVGGKIDERWFDILIEAAKSGIDIVSGLHINLQDNKQLLDAANSGNASLINIRIPPKNIPIGSGRKRTGKRLLTVGTDCAVGKKYTALALAKAMKKKAFDVSFRASGQTGIMIAGNGIPIDSVVADFISGAAEMISPQNSEHHWDIIEGQGSLFHPAFSGVSLGLLHGSQPDAIVICHEAKRERISGFPEHFIPDIKECIEENLRCARLTNPNVICIGVSINSSRLSQAYREIYLKNLTSSLGIPCVDPLIDGCDGIINELLNNYY